MQFLGHSSEAGCSARLVRQKSAESGNLTSVEQAMPPHFQVPDELASPHSITSSARASNVGGTVRPSALAPGVAAMSFERTKDPLAEGVRHY